MRYRQIHNSLDDFIPATQVDSRLEDLKLAKRPGPAELKSTWPSSMYPRIERDDTMSQQEFARRFNPLSLPELREKYMRTSIRIRGEEEAREERYRILLTEKGKVVGLRWLSSMLAFVDVARGGAIVQVLINMGALQRDVGYSPEESRDFRKLIRKGDYFRKSPPAFRATLQSNYWAEFEGSPTKSREKDSTSQVASLFCTKMPEMLSPGLHDVPTKITDPETLARIPQFALQVSQERKNALRLRSVLENTLQRYLHDNKFTKVTTPILAADTGGAIARPFFTRATEFSDQQLKLRISQELHLKMLVAADFGPVYEMGPVFRNEGLDATHNPEFTTCEFYKPYGNLEDVIETTEAIFEKLFLAAQHCKKETSFGFPIVDVETNISVVLPFRRLQFLPTLVDQLVKLVPNFKFPRNLNETSVQQFKDIFKTLKISLPEKPDRAAHARRIRKQVCRAAL